MTVRKPEYLSVGRLVQLENAEGWKLNGTLLKNEPTRRVLTLELGEGLILEVPYGHVAVARVFHLNPHLHS